DWDVVVATNDAPALSYCAQQSFDAIIADQHIVTEGGVDFLNKSIAFCPGAVRVLIIDTSDVFLTIRGTYSAQVHRFLLRSEATIHLGHVVRDVLAHKSIEQGRLLVLRESTIPTGSTINALRRILVEERMRMAYQPIVRASDGQVIAHEALC